MFKAKEGISVVPAPLRTLIRPPEAAFLLTLKSQTCPTATYGFYVHARWYFTLLNNDAFCTKKKNGKIYFFLHRLLQDVEDTTGSDTPGVDSCFNVNYAKL